MKILLALILQASIASAGTLPCSMQLSSPSQIVTKEQFLSVYEAVLLTPFKYTSDPDAILRAYIKLLESPLSLVNAAQTELVPVSEGLIRLKEIAKTNHLPIETIDSDLRKTIWKITKGRTNNAEILIEVKKNIIDPTIHQSRVKALGQMSDPKFIPGTKMLADKSVDGVVIFPFGKFADRKFIPDVGRVDQIQLFDNSKKALIKTFDKKTVLTFVDLVKAKVIKVFNQIDADSLNEVFASETGKYIAAHAYVHKENAGTIHQIGIYDANTEEKIITLENAEKISFSPDEKYALLIGNVNEPDEARLIDLTTKKIRKIQNGNHLEQNLYTHDGKEILHVWSAPYGKKNVTFTDLATGEMRKTFQIGVGGPGDSIATRSIALSDDGKTIYVGWANGEFTVYNVESSQLLYQMKFTDRSGTTAIVQHINLSADQSRVMAVSETGEALVLNMANLEEIYSFSTEAALSIFGSDLNPSGEKVTITIMAKDYTFQTYFFSLGRPK